MILRIWPQDKKKTLTIQDLNLIPPVYETDALLMKLKS